MPPHKKSNKSNTATLVWDANSKAGIALTKGVMEGTIKKNVPTNIVKESNDELWGAYPKPAFRNALKRAFAAKEKLEQQQKATKDEHSRSGKAREKMCGASTKNGKCFFVYSSLLQVPGVILTCIVTCYSRM